MLSNRQVILLKLESVYKTDPTPSASTDAILVESLDVAPSGLRMIDRPVIEASIGTRQSIYGGTLYNITFSMEVKGSGAAGTAPECGAALQCCGFLETVSAGVSVAYTPVSTGIKSCTIWRYFDGHLEKYSGCRGTVSFAGEVGGKGMLNFTFTGHKMAHTDTALATPTYDAAVPVPIIGGAFSADSYAAVISALSFDMGNTVGLPPDWNSANGFAEIIVSKRNPVGSFNPERVLLATHNFFTLFESSGTAALSTGPIGSTAGQIWTLTAPAVSYTGMGEGDREGKAIYDIPIKYNYGSGDDELALTFT
jgi:hypothetical protein